MAPLAPPSVSWSATTVVASLLLLLIAVSVPSASAWWDKGHVAIAMIAEKHMAAAQLAKSHAIAAMLSSTIDVNTSLTFVQLGLWFTHAHPDLIATTKKWDAALLHLPPYLHTQPPTWSTPTVAAAVTSLLLPSSSSLASMLCESLQSPSATAETAVVLLPWLMYLVSEIHSPMHRLHAVDDAVGRRMVIVDENETWFLLRCYWESMAEGPTAEPLAQPLSADTHRSIAELAARIEATHTTSVTDAERKNVDMRNISLSAHDLALKYAAPDAVDGGTLSEAYKTMARLVTERQVLLAGLRLATVLDTCLAPLRLLATEVEANREEEGDDGVLSHGWTEWGQHRVPELLTFVAVVLVVSVIVEGLLAVLVRYRAASVKISLDDFIAGDV